MKTLNAFAALTVILGSFVVTGCRQEVSHTESDKPNWTDNGHTQQESTTYRNPDGTTSTDTSKTRTSN